MRTIRALVSATALLLVPAFPAEAACRQALVMALDVSGSVNENEYALQLQGLATALEDPDVQRALFVQPEAPVFVAVFEWSGGEFQRLIVDWRALDSSMAVAEVTQRLRDWDRVPAPLVTSIGGALRFASDMLARAPACWKKTIDVSGDGKNNDRPLPQDIRQIAALRGVTINALVIGSPLQRVGDSGPGEVAELSAYFSAQVIKGPRAFVEVALGYENYADAMARKLLRELETATVGDLPPGSVQPPTPVQGHISPITSAYVAVGTARIPTTGKALEAVALPKPEPASAAPFRQR